ncbi:MAG: sulfurtransferase TusA family protein [Nannocystaceae bacterium]
MDAFLDCKGLNCPMPIVRLSQAMRGLSPGQRLVIEATDPAFRPDLEAWVRRFGHTVASLEMGPVIRAVVIKS